jgi:hypothetical protein
VSLLKFENVKVHAEELPNGNFLVMAEGPDGLWLSCSNSLHQATGEANYATMIGEPPTHGTATASAGAHMQKYDELTGEFHIVPTREWVIWYAGELRKLG